MLNRAFSFVVPRPGCSLDDNGVEFPIGQIWSPGDPCELCICQVNGNLHAFSCSPNPWLSLPCPEQNPLALTGSSLPLPKLSLSYAGRSHLYRMGCEPLVREQSGSQEQDFPGDG